MKMLISENDLSNLRSRDKVPLECVWCKKTFYGEKHNVMANSSNPLRKNRMKFCSKLCRDKSRNTLEKCQCIGCGKEVVRYPIHKRRYKNVFCTLSCRAIWANKNDRFRGTRSKLEKWIEENLTKLYPDLIIRYNDRKELSGLELDIFIPSLSLAFELNGIFHYETIRGQEKFDKAKNNDNTKFQACIEKKIDLCIIDTYHATYLKKERDQKFLDIIISIIHRKQGLTVVNT